MESLENKAQVRDEIKRLKKEKQSELEEINNKYDRLSKICKRVSIYSMGAGFLVGAAILGFDLRETNYQVVISGSLMALMLGTVGGFTGMVASEVDRNGYLSNTRNNYNEKKDNLIYKFFMKD